MLTKGGNRLLPGLLAGAVIGVLSSLPFVSAANCCCLWIFGGGVLASYLCQQNQDEPISVSDALAVGAIAALSGAVIGLLVSIPLEYFTAPLLRRAFVRLLDVVQDAPPEFREAVESLSESGAINLAARVLWFLGSVLLYLVVVPAGAILGALVFQKPAVSAAPVMSAPGSQNHLAGDVPGSPLPPLPLPLVSTDGDASLRPASESGSESPRGAWEEAPATPPEPPAESSAITATTEMETTSETGEPPTPPKD